MSMSMITPPKSKARGDADTPLWKCLFKVVLCVIFWVFLFVCCLVNSSLLALKNKPLRGEARCGFDLCYLRREETEFLNKW